MAAIFSFWMFKSAMAYLTSYFQILTSRSTERPVSLARYLSLKSNFLTDLLKLSFVVEANSSMSLMTLATSKAKILLFCLV
eukprot:UN21981